MQTQRHMHRLKIAVKAPQAQEQQYNCYRNEIIKKRQMP